MSYRRLQIYFFLAVFMLSLALSFFIFKPYLGLMVFSGVLAVLMRPVYRRLVGHFHNFTLASLSTVFLTLMLILLPLMFMAAALATEAVDLFNVIRSQLNFSEVASSLARIIGPEQAHAVAVEASRAVSDVASYVQPFVNGLTSNIVAIFSNTFAFVLGFIIVLMGMYYLLKDGRTLKRQLMDLSPLADADDTAIFDRIIDAVKAVALGQFVIALIKGVLGIIVFLVLGLPAPVFWGTMVALTNFIPGIGTALVTVPFVIYLFAAGRFWSAVALLIISVFIIGLIDNFLTPQLMKSRIKIHPLLILLSMLGGISLFGGLGLFFGPIALSVTLAMLDIYKKEFRSSVEKIERM